MLTEPPAGGGGFTTNTWATGCGGVELPPAFVAVTDTW